MIFTRPHLLQQGIMVYFIPGIMVSFVILTQSSITWEDSLNEGLSRIGWPIGGCLIYSLMWRPSLLWAAPFSRRVSELCKNGENELSTSKRGALLLSLCSDSGSDVVSCLIPAVTSLCGGL